MNVRLKKLFFTVLHVLIMSNHKCNYYYYTLYVHIQARVCYAHYKSLTVYVCVYTVCIHVHVCNLHCMYLCSTGLMCVSGCQCRRAVLRGRRASGSLSMTALSRQMAVHSKGTLRWALNTYNLYLSQTHKDRYIII